VHTPKQWQLVEYAEIELNVLTSQCLNRRIDQYLKTVKKEVAAWQEFRANKNAKVKLAIPLLLIARVKLSRLYPTLNS